MRQIFRIVWIASVLGLLLTGIIVYWSNVWLTIKILGVTFILLSIVAELFLLLAANFLWAFGEGEFLVLWKRLRRRHLLYTKFDEI